LKDLDGPDEQTMQGVLHGLSTRDNKGVVDYLEEGFCLSHRAVSRKFIRTLEEKLKKFESRDPSDHSIMTIFIDAKYLARQQMVIVMGITERGEKLILGLLQTGTENSQAISDRAIFVVLLLATYSFLKRATAKHAASPSASSPQTALH
jgi:transposase-like protein